MAISQAADAVKSATPEIPKHTQLEDKLGKYCGLVLYMKEMDEERYQKLCAVSVPKIFFQDDNSPLIPYRTTSARYQIYIPKKL